MVLLHFEEWRWPVAGCFIYFFEFENLLLPDVVAVASINSASFLPVRSFQWKKKKHGCGAVRDVQMTDWLLFFFRLNPNCHLMRSQGRPNSRCNSASFPLPSSQSCHFECSIFLHNIFNFFKIYFKKKKDVAPSAHARFPYCECFLCCPQAPPTQPIWLCPFTLWTMNSGMRSSFPHPSPTVSSLCIMLNFAERRKPCNCPVFFFFF